MRELLQGNEAVARGLYEAGAGVVSSYPGTPSTEITEFAATYPELYSEWAPNEKVALEVAFGASLSGARSFAAMKHVGLNVAADPLFTSSYTGVGRGLVVAVADDPGMHSSQNEQDSRNYAKASKIPMLEPADSQECLDYTKMAFALSEEYDTPVLLRLTTRISHSRSLVATGSRLGALPEYEYKRDIAKYVMTPGGARPKHVAVEARTAALTKRAEESPLNTIEWHDKKIGVITAGITYQYAKEALGDGASYCKLGLVWPLPEKLLREFAAQVETLYVIEELDSFIEDHCRKIGLNVIGKELFPLCGEISQRIIREKIKRETVSVTEFGEPVPGRPPVMCAGCPHRTIFHALSREKIYISGDIGCYTLGSAPPLSAMDSVICMGGSISGAHGFSKGAGGVKTVAVIGDSTFAHSGMTGLVNTVYNRSNTLTIILDNSITGMTGHQQNPTTGVTLKGDITTALDLEMFVKSVGITRLKVVDPYDLPATGKTIREELAYDGPSVIIARRPCVLLKTVKHEAPLRVDEEKCTGCKACLRIGCPAISMRDKKSVIDKSQCVGCTQCVSLCKFGAIVS